MVPAFFAVLLVWYLRSCRPLAAHLSCYRRFVTQKSPLAGGVGIYGVGENVTGIAISPCTDEVALLIILPDQTGCGVYPEVHSIPVFERYFPKMGL